MAGTLCARHPPPQKKRRPCWPLGIVFLVLAVLLISTGIVIVHRNEQRLEDEAERALPGPLDVSFPRG